MHVGHVNVNNEKMSKSLGNFVLAKDLLEKYGANAVR
jgi:cysteinyl-tRNA synthetase